MDRITARRLTMAGLAIVSLLAIGGTSSQAAAPFVAGGRSTHALPSVASDVARARARGEALSRALGLPGRPERVERLLDEFDHRTYDEITNVDGAGREVAISRLDLDGTPAMAVTLGWQPSHGRPVDGAGASARATTVALAAGLRTVGTPAVHRSAGAGGWAASWARVVDGVTVRGDGLRVLLWVDGSFHGLTRTERPLAARPGRTLQPTQARTTATAFLAQRFGDPPGLTATAVEAAWVAPNRTFDPAAPDAPDAVLRLAWVVTFEADGELAERVRAVQVWIDAGDGRVIGGDVAE